MKELKTLFSFYEMEFVFNHHGKDRKIDVANCSGILNQARGLMFGNDKKALLFDFGKLSRRGIHSFFCRPFYAIWFKNSEIVDEKLVYPWIFWIAPKEKFDKLLEIPSRCKDFRNFVDEENI